VHWFLEVLKKYAVFSGRARRREFWWFILISWLLDFVPALIDTALDTLIVFQMVYALFLLLPTAAVTVRRLHDTDRSGWWALLALIPIVDLFLLVFLVRDSKPHVNAHGASPKQVPVPVPAPAR
jgi:uncharacterized membrane protein YhaH (DUF805 family)